MSAYDRKAWEGVQDWRRKRLEVEQRHILPEGVRTRVAQAREVTVARVKEVPGTDVVLEVVGKSISGAFNGANRVSMATVRPTAVAKAYSKRGHPVTELDDIAKLELRVVDKVKPRIDIAYMLTSAAEGVGTGVALSGAEITGGGATAATGGAAALPTAAAIAGLIAADTVAVIVASSRAVAHIAAYYGYDTGRAEEQAFALGVLNFGFADQASKAAAYAQLTQLVHKLATKAVWKELDKNTITQVVKGVYKAFGEKITKKKLAQALPFVGALIGGAMNARTLMNVTSDAEFLYRERFLREQYGLAMPEVSIAVGEPDDVVDIAEIIEDVMEAEPDERDDGLD